MVKLDEAFTKSGRKRVRPLVTEPAKVRTPEDLEGGLKAYGLRPRRFGPLVGKERAR